MLILTSGVKEWILDPELFEREISGTQRAKWVQYYTQQPFGRTAERIAWAHTRDASLKAKVGALEKGQPGIKINYWDWMLEGKPQSIIEQEQQARQARQAQQVQHAKPLQTTQTAQPTQLGPGLMTKEKWAVVKRQAISFEKAR